MENLKSNKLILGKVIFSMGIIMLTWALFWYPFDYFIFSENLSTQIEHLLAISREYLRMLPAIFFLIHYRDSIKTNFKELFSLKFNYKWFLITLFVFVAYISAHSYFTKGKICFNPQKMMPYDMLLSFNLGLCQELVFRGWSFNAFKEVTSQKNDVILSSAFFSASHWFAHFFMFFNNQFNLVYFILVTIFTFIFGILMCFIIIKTKSKSIVPLVILHTVWDFLAAATH